MFKGADMEIPANKLPLLAAELLGALAFLFVLFGSPVLVLALQRIGS
jgi:hypothetical protein